jgi:HAD superfamily hydrolase (TIGR01509 family)
LNKKLGWRNMASKRLQAILFDMDGTLLDSREAIIPAFEYALRQHNVPVPPLAELMPYSHSLRALQEAVAPHVPYKDLLASYDGRLQTLLHTVVPYDGVIETLGKLKRRHKLGVVSSARRALQAVKLYGLEDFFDVVVGGLDVTPHKPHPAPVLLALERLDVRPENAAMVGDLAADILAAKAASVGLVIGVTHGFGSREMLEAEGADYVVDNWPEVLRVIEIF